MWPRCAGRLAPSEHLSRRVGELAPLTGVAVDVHVERVVDLGELPGLLLRDEPSLADQGRGGLVLDRTVAADDRVALLVGHVEAQLSELGQGRRVVEAGDAEDRGTNVLTESVEVDLDGLARSAALDSATVTAVAEGCVERGRVELVSRADPVEVPVGGHRHGVQVDLTGTGGASGHLAEPSAAALFDSPGDGDEVTAAKQVVVLAQVGHGVCLHTFRLRPSYGCVVQES